VITLAPFAPYRTAFLLETADGMLAGVHIPAVPAPVPEETMACLHRAERQVAETHRAYRQVQYVGGRLAIGLALRALDVPTSPVLSDRHGAPIVPDGTAGSISHKRQLAVAIACRREGGLGVDLEDTTRPRRGIEDEILCGEELAALAGLGDADRWQQVIARFSIKEALYKAIHPFVQRPIGFREVAIALQPDGVARVDARFPEGARFVIDAHCQAFDRWTLSVVTVRPKKS
jgi:enterobactin synthetase component D